MRIVEQVELKIGMGNNMKKPKVLKFWNGRPYVIDIKKGNLNIAAYSKADAIRMLQELYPRLTVGQAYPELTNYFSGCWGNDMDKVTPTRGVWLVTDEWSQNPVVTQIYPINKA